VTQPLPRLLQNGTINNVLHADVVQSGTYSYTYDGTDMMTGMSTGSRDFRYVYTADDERIGTYDVSTQTWSWKLRDIGGKPLREFTSSGGTLGFANWAWAKDYIYRGNTILASITPSETQHFHSDHLGTPRLITGASGVQRGRHDYYPFGAESTSSLQNNQLLKFTGHERDLNGPSGSEDRDYLDYMHARYYNPNLGRFLSVDPVLNIERALRKPQGWNRYAYVENNPINARDPDGRAIDTLFDIVFIAHDVLDIGATLVAGDRPTIGQWAALGGDVLGAAIPFATGLGVAARGLTKADDFARLGTSRVVFEGLEVRAVRVA
jgi:RHS repeat-associated protein